MAEEKRVLVKLGDSNRPVSFLSDGENDQDVLNEEIRKVYRDEIPVNSSFILQIKDEEWGGEFVDISSAQTNIVDKSILKVVVKKVKPNVFTCMVHYFISVLLCDIVYIMMIQLSESLPSSDPCCSHSLHQVCTLAYSMNKF